MRLEWDPVKARLNIARHGISFKEASSVFNDPLAVTIEDPTHSHEELREITVGVSSLARLLVVYHVERGDRIRIIGARLPTRKERQDHEGAGRT
jgi:uncharacterized protein